MRGQRVRQTAGTQLRFGSPFVQQSCVVDALVGTAEFVETFLGFAPAIRNLTAELVGDRETEGPDRQLVCWVDRRNVAADGLRLFLLVQRAVDIHFAAG